MGILPTDLQAGRRKVLASGEFGEFFNANKEWLQPYAVFSYLRDAFQTPNFREWPRHSVYNAQDIEKMCRPESVDYPHIALYYYIQFHLHLQLVAATKYAREHGVVLKGDIPIGISRNSVEAWTEPYYFNLNGQAGAPPDDFSVNGQNWGFPTYNWDVMEKDGYRWWMKRFQKCQSTSTLTGLTTSLVSSVSGKSRCMPYTDYSDSSFPPSL